MQEAATLRIRIRLHCGDEIAMGPGKADILEAIRAHGSISAAARALGMSYRRCWLLVDAMNRCWEAPLVETFPGSARGHGARVTAAGDEVLGHYRALQRAVGNAGRGGDFKALASRLLPQPKASRKA